MWAPVRSWAAPPVFDHYNPFSRCSRPMAWVYRDGYYHPMGSARERAAMTAQASRRRLCPRPSGVCRFAATGAVAILHAPLRLTGRCGKRPEACNAAQVIFQHSRLHWRETMVPAAIRMELAFADTKGWGRKPADRRLLTVAAGPMAAEK